VDCDATVGQPRQRGFEPAFGDASAGNAPVDPVPVVVGLGTAPNVGDTDTVTFQNARLRPTKPR
jgi:hypothetical protein